MNNTEIIAQLRRIDCALSPENLTCDGELPMTQVRAREKQLRKERAKFVKLLGREPTFQEIYGI